ncbi:MAG: serine hydrolase domain-containing protein [Ignavibacteria bacterium]
MKKLTILFFTVLITLSGKVYTQFDKDIAQFIDSYADSMMTTAQQPGMIISITRGDTIIYEQAKGIANIETGEKMHPGMRFRIGSLTKTFTVTVLLQLVDQGLLKLDDPVNKFFSLAIVPGGDSITVRMLADMTSGLYNYSELEEFNTMMSQTPGRKWKPEELVSIAVKKEPYFKPGLGWHYSNTNTVLIGMIIEKLTVHSLEEEIKIRIIDKLGLKNTDFATVPEISGYHPEGYGEDDASFVYPWVDVTEKYDPSWGWAAGAMISDIYDLKIYLKALAEGTLISPEMQKERLKWGLDKDGLKYGAGIFQIGNFLGHNGSYPGFHNISVHSPKSNITVIIFFNSQSNRSPDDFLKALLPLIE